MHLSHAFLTAVALIVCGLQFAEAGYSSSVASVQSYTVPPNFPTALFSQYYYGASPTQQPQPKIFDQVLKYTYPLELTDPTQIQETPEDPRFYPTAIGVFSNATDMVTAAQAEIAQILASNDHNCTKCKNALVVGKFLAQRVPTLVPNLLVDLCVQYKYATSDSCYDSFSSDTVGAAWTQVLALGNMSGHDGEYVCNSLSSAFCPKPYTMPANMYGYYDPRPSVVNVPKPSGQRVKVLHLSDMHLDPRYAVGQEANCESGMCCRFPTRSNNFTKITSPASTYGHYTCDAPYYLITAALESIGPLTGTTLDYDQKSLTDHFAWSIFTGDVVSHDPERQLSQNYTEYEEWSAYHMLKAYVPGGPIFGALGNHDSSPTALDVFHNMPGKLGEQQSWNYNHVASLWQNNGWISAAAAAQARTHYAGYSINHPKYPKLRIITLNSDFWYRSNWYNFINTTGYDNSGSLYFLSQELQEAEKNNMRAWIIGHVPTGWDGSNGLPNPTDAFYSIVDRFSPHVIAAIFFGHTHEDQTSIYYTNNGTVQNSSTAQNVAWIGPSLTPLTNLNAGYRMYEVDTGDFSVYNAYTYFSNVSTYSHIDAESSGPVFELEYSTRAAYPVEGGWPDDAPLNATYWHLVTEAMEARPELATLYNTYQGKSSVKSPNCTSTACVAAKICYIRSGSVGLGSLCPQGFGSVQSHFTGKNH